MPLPYANATAAASALEEIRKLLTKFCCQRFGTMTDTEHGELMVQFTFRNRDVIAKASYRRYAGLPSNRVVPHRTDLSGCIRVDDLALRRMRNTLALDMGR